MHQLIERASECLGDGSCFAKGDPPPSLFCLLHHSEWKAGLLGDVALSTVRLDPCRPDGSREGQLVRGAAIWITRHTSPVFVG